MMDAVTNELLVYGYIREESKCNIPVAIINLCLTFGSNIFFWAINNKKLLDIFSNNNNNNNKNNKNIDEGECIKDTSIYLRDNIKFNCVLFPDGWNEETIYDKHIKDKGSSILSLEISEYNGYPKTVKYFVMYYELECKQLNILWKGVDEFESMEDVASWDSKTLSSLQLKSFIDNKNKNKNKLEIRYKMSILYIKYNTWREFYIKCFMKKYNEFTWKLTDKFIEIVDPLNIDKNNIETRYYSPNFLNNCWCIYIKRINRNEHGINCSDNNIYWCLGLCLLRLPPKIKKIATEIEIYCNDEKLNLEDKYFKFDKVLFSYSGSNTKRSSSFPVQETPKIKLYDLWCIDPLCLKLKIKIKITDIFTRDRYGGRVGRFERVKKKEWRQHGVFG